MKWLSREFINGPYLILCTSQKRFNKVLKYLCIKERDNYISHVSDAKMWEFEANNGDLCCVVCIAPSTEVTREQLYGLLVHEAVHVFDKYCLFINEKSPSSEFKAYSIQAISQRLFIEYERQINKKCKSQS